MSEKRQNGTEAAGELRYDPEIGPSYFTLTPNDFLEHSDELSAVAKLLYIVLLMHCGRGDKAYPGNDRLCKMCSVKSRTTLLTARKELEAVGLVEVVRRGLNMPNLYIVHKYELVSPKVARGADVQNLNNRDVQNLNVQDGQKMDVQMSKLRTSRRSTVGHELDSVQQDSDQQDIDSLHSQEIDGSGVDEEIDTSPLPQYSPWIGAMITDYSREMGDMANISVNVNKAIRIWQESRLGEAAFVEVLQQARAVTRKAQGSRDGVANKMRRLLQEATKLAANGSGTSA